MKSIVLETRRSCSVSDKKWLLREMCCTKYKLRRTMVSKCQKKLRSETEVEKFKN